MNSAEQIAQSPQSLLLAGTLISQVSKGERPVSDIEAMLEGASGTTKEQMLILLRLAKWSGYEQSQAL